MKEIRFTDIRNRDIYRRKYNDKKYINENKLVSDNCKLYLSRLNDTCSSKLIFVKECAKDVNSCNKYFKEILEVCEEDNSLYGFVIDNIAPKIFNTNGIIIKNDLIREEIECNKIYDRILDNHHLICDRYNLTESFLDKRSVPDYAIFKICETVSNFKLPVHGKVIVALEEYYYLHSKLYGEYVITENDVDNVASYYSFANTKDFNNELLTKSLLGNKLIKVNNFDSDLAGCTYNDITNSSKLFNLFDNILTDAEPNQMFSLLTKYMSCLNIIMISGKDDYIKKDIVEQILPYIYKKSYDVISEMEFGVTFVIEMTIKIIEEAERKIYEYYKVYSDSNSLIGKYVAGLSELKEKFINLLNMSYTDYNLKAMSVSEEENDISLSDYKKQELDSITNIKNTIDSEVEKIATDGIVKIRPNDMVPIDVYDTIDPNTGRSDTVVSVIKIDDGVSSEIQKVCSEFIKNINENLLKKSKYNCYYTASENFVLFSIKSNDKVILTNEEQQQLENHIDSYDKYFFEEFLNMSDQFAHIEDITVESFNDFFSYCNPDECVSDILELASYAQIDRELIKSIDTSKWSYKSKLVIDKYQPSTINEVDTNLFALNSLGMLLALEESFINEAENFKKPDVTPKKAKVPDFNNPGKVKKEVPNKVEKQKQRQPVDNKPTFKEKVANTVDKANTAIIKFLNTLKLANSAIQSKTREMSAKEKELSRNLDASVNHFSNEVKRAFENDSREQVIKGSVIPSFSKCVKICVAAAGSALIDPTHIIAPLAIIIGYIGISSKNKNAQKQALLDELSVELEMIDREIAQAESSGKNKRLRALLTTKKDLERQYQRLKLGSRVKGKVLPSKVGVPDRD